jgi:uncharacterized protein YjgD (DUF1641 family)
MTSEIERAILNSPEEVAARLEEMDVEDEVLEDVDTDAEGGQVRRTVEANQEELSAGLEKVVRLERDGTLDELVEIADAVTVLSSALDDEMVMSVAEMGGSFGEVADTASEDDSVDTLDSAVRSLSKAKRESEPMGLLGAVRASRSKEFRRSLGFLVSVAQNLGEELDED